MLERSINLFLPARTLLIMTSAGWRPCLASLIHSFKISIFVDNTHLRKCQVFCRPLPSRALKVHLGESKLEDDRYGKRLRHNGDSRVSIQGRTGLFWWSSLVRIWVMSHPPMMVGHAGSCSLFSSRQFAAIVGYLQQVRCFAFIYVFNFFCVFSNSLMLPSFEGFCSATQSKHSTLCG